MDEAETRQGSADCLRDRGSRNGSVIEGMGAGSDVSKAS